MTFTSLKEDCLLWCNIIIQYVCHVENQATVIYLQKVGRTGHLTTLDILPPPPPPPPPAAAAAGLRNAMYRRISLSCMPVLAIIASLSLFPSQTTRASLTLVAIPAMLVLSRILSTISLRARTSRPSWNSASKTGVKRDLHVLLSEDRWIRIRGLADNLKAVTSGAWLSRLTAHPVPMDALDWIARMMVYSPVVALSGRWR
ncbi:uncharacterized protein A1O5_03991 [Cladophialophora psammophila CBS 110553]|uniref:Uncharacterized protein n=1 Tax=Cladophialophora psammophila CBS 110553 TaxID=1182543 RepID=W9WY48_9EURO|nr:uncharacterized protein A1O5_03991 [Cladophialophora psammophila CBS 110553]EXJ72843.1 hypothetical protein A1O5_03991 [Cladophialophora psammophila CBS 110553]